MSDIGYTGNPFSRDGGGGTELSVAVSTLQNIARQMGLWVQAYNGRIVGGSFTLSNATTTVVSESNVQSGSIIMITPTNATAALIQRTLGVYISAKTTASTFSVTCQNGSAFGTETFGYILFTPT